METPSTTAEAAAEGSADRQGAVQEAASRLPWSNAELERQSAQEDRRVAEARERESRGLESYPDCISTEDLHERADKLRHAPTAAS